ncbi:MAG: right-handed parallel beta-helix repeat-containing protein [Actinobacteria bacterium]|nr:right-handed parallel beta-helix repeat-containing protein [Actinomycetota bacterium]
MYGIFAFGSRCGQFDNSYTSGNSDSGFYIGECFPCDAVIHHVDAEQNAIGYSGTNAGGNLVIRDSVWKDNALAIVPNSLDGEQRPPQRGVTIKNNEVLHNNGINNPGTGIAGEYYGGGVVLAGGQSNAVYGNTITDNALVGVLITPLPDMNVWIPSGNTVWGNNVSHDSGAYPDAFDLAQGAGSGPNNCWADNTFSNSAPIALQEVWSCSLTATPPGGDPRAEVSLVEGAAGLNGRVDSPWQDWPPPSLDKQTQTDDLDGAVDYWLPGLGI